MKDKQKRKYKNKGNTNTLYVIKCIIQFDNIHSYTDKKVILKMI